MATVVDQSRSAGAEFAVVICGCGAHLSHALPLSVYHLCLAGWLAGGMVYDVW